LTHNPQVAKPMLGGTVMDDLPLYVFVGLLWVLTMVVGPGSITAVGGLENTAQAGAGHPHL
jgi:hypothetical protein